MYRHRIYLSSMSLRHLEEFAKRFPSIKPNVLLSYALLDSDLVAFTDTHRHLMESLILDSGVYSLNNPTNRLNQGTLFSKYLTYCTYSHSKWDLVFNFDAHFGLNSYNGNLVYQVQLEAAGIQPVPVVHNIYNDDADKVIARGLANHKAVAIGQCSGRTSMKNIRPMVEKLHYAGARVHFFGSSEFRLMAQLPISCCDSTSWCKYPSMGIVLYWNPKKNSFDKTDKIHFPKHQDAPSPQGSQYYNKYGYLKDFEEYLGHHLGLTITDLLGRNADLYRGVVNMLYYCLLEEVITKHQTVAMGYHF